VETVLGPIREKDGEINSEDIWGTFASSEGRVPVNSFEGIFLWTIGKRKDQRFISVSLERKGGEGERERERTGILTKGDWPVPLEFVLKGDSIRSS